MGRDRGEGAGANHDHDNDSMPLTPFAISCVVCAMQGLQCLTWVAVKPAPRDFIENFVGASDFWGNKIRVQHRKTSPEQMAFVDNFKKLIVELMPYVKEYHTTGVAWNPQVGPPACQDVSVPPSCGPQPVTRVMACVCTGRGH